MDDHTTTPRLRADGSFDTAYYLQRGRTMRSEQAHRMIGTTGPRRRGPVALLISLVLLPFVPFM